ncbi:MAG TPA: efflux RND transporter permease subunit, partial [Plasticicumulans sp.]|nr:efflux RND transporter permease subunit [Plasticicumulans sp.]
MISRFFIDRPVFAGVLSIVIVIAGLAAMSGLPIAQFPEITPPLLQITASYPGADAETASGTVAAPIEQQVNGVDNMIYMQSNNSNSGDTGLNVYFDIGTDVDRVLTDLTNRANLANPQLPQDVTRNGVVIKKSSPNILMAITILSDGSRDPNEVANYTSINIVDELKRIPGANQVSMFGLTDYAMRIWLRPDRMAELGITTADVRKAIQEQNTQPAAGRIGQEPTAGPVQLSFPVTARGRLSTPEEFDDIMVRSNPDGSSIRIRDIARSELGIRSYDVSSQLNGKDATVILVYQQPGANALTVATDIRAALDRLSKNFPSGVSYVVPYDTTKFVEVSIE